MAKSEYNADEWVIFTDPPAPAPMKLLKSASALSAAFGKDSERLCRWCAKSIAAWHLLDGDGVLIEDAPSPEAFDRLDYERLKWLFTEVVRVTFELPPSSASASRSVSTPAAAA